MAHVTETVRTVPTGENSLGAPVSWLNDFKNVIASLQVTFQEVTSLLCIVAASISTSRPMPPYLKAPRPIQLGQLLANIDNDILSTRHVLEPGYADFAVIQVSYTLLGDDLEGLLEEAKKLVGEAKFDVDTSRI